MPPIRSSTSKRRTRIIAVILLLSKIMPTYSRYVLKELICIIITALFSRQLSSYAKYTNPTCDRLAMFARCLLLSVYILCVLAFYKVCNFLI